MECRRRWSIGDPLTNNIVILPLSSLDLTLMIKIFLSESEAKVNKIRLDHDPNV